MIYPKNFEQKIGFTEVRNLLKARCLSTLGQDQADAMAFSADREQIDLALHQTREMRHIRELQPGFPDVRFYDVRSCIARLRLEGTHIDEEELPNVQRTLDAVIKVEHTLNEQQQAEEEDPSRPPRYVYPCLHEIADGIATFPQLVRRIALIIDEQGRIRDNASPDLLQIRRSLASTRGSVSRVLYGILKAAQSEGVVEKDVAPTMRDGRLVIPVAPALKRKIQGIVHDESATGKTVFVEPAQVVEANNRIRELEGEERREIIRILTEVSKIIRPNVREILDSLRFLAQVDFIQAKARLADDFNAIEPELSDGPYIDWIEARHPLLERQIKREGKEDKHIVPLDIMLTPEKRILIISGPNAGGKSVCLKTVGLLQYMLQCGISLPASERSKAGVFQNIMIDIGDEQSIENDLSTYSSHLMNMKMMIRHSNTRTLLLIDEFGTGTEPQIGGAIAEACLGQFCRKGAWGVITTHYQNLKHFADSHKGVANGAMLYDRKEMQPLFRLAIGRPGSSFAIEIARQTGLPEEVIKEASEIVGSDYIQSDKYLQDIVRDKRYWESKRDTIHQQEKALAASIERYEKEVADLRRQRKEVLSRAKAEAEQMLTESNKRIENTIREIRESQAEKEETHKLRQQLDDYKNAIAEVDTQADDEKIARKIEEIKNRKVRREQRKKERAAQREAQQRSMKTALEKKKEGIALSVGDTVRMKGLTSVGKIESIEGKDAVAVFGGMRTRLPLARLEHADPPKETEVKVSSVSRMTRQTIDSRREDFNPEIDVRGMRGDEALLQVQSYIDDAVLVGIPSVRILHGKGNGILRQLIREYLGTVPQVSSYRDEHVQFGGAGITVVEL